MRSSLIRFACGLLVSGLALGQGAADAQAQSGQSAPLAQELMGLLQQQGLDAVAARVPGAENRFVAALALAGSQLLVVSGEYSAPDLLTPTLESKSYRDVYVELQSASVYDSRIFVTDLGADGLVSRPGSNEPFDTYMHGADRTPFDGDWRAQDLSEDDYMARFSEADEQYAEMLQALVSELK